MKKILLSMCVTLVSTQAFAMRMECFLRSGSKSTPSQIVDTNTTITLGSDIKLEASSAISCGLDGGPCAKNPHLDLSLTVGNSRVRTSTYDTVVGLVFEADGIDVMVSCNPAIGSH
jgi:hypothetical protein